MLRFPCQKKMEKDHNDQVLEGLITAPLKTGGKHLAAQLGRKISGLGKRLMFTAGKGMLMGLKALITPLLALVLIILVVVVTVGVIYTVLLKPIGTYNELKSMPSTGKTLAIYLDIDDEWDEQLDKEAMEKYETFKDKNIEGLTVFEKNQAQQFALPYSIITSIERMELFSWGVELQERTGLDKWQPRPEEVYEALKTNYEWIDSKVEYEMLYTYTYDYTYYYDEYIEPEYNVEGELIKEGYWKTNEVTDYVTKTEIINLPFDVRLLKAADAFDDFYTHEYGDYEVDENMISGTRSFYMSNTGNILVDKDNIETQPDSYEGLLLDSTLSDEITNSVKKNVENVIDKFEENAYGINFNISVEVDSATKKYQPLEQFIPSGNQFERIVDYLKERYSLDTIHEIDLRMIFEIAADYDEDFAYNFAVNSDGFINFSNMRNFYYGEVLSGGLAWPVPKEFNQRISSPFGPRWGKFHYGIDIASGGVPIPIIAVADGVVAFANWNGGYGNCVIISHGENDSGQKVDTLYAHLNRYSVKAGQEVKQGEVIGIMGTTGRSTGIHLHYEIRVNSSRQNPLNFYEKNIYQNL